MPRLATSPFKTCDSRVPLVDTLRGPREGDEEQLSLGQQQQQHLALHRRPGPPVFERIEVEFQAAGDSETSESITYTFLHFH